MHGHAVAQLAAAVIASPLFGLSPLRFFAEPALRDGEALCLAALFSPLFYYGFLTVLGAIFAKYRCAVAGITIAYSTSDFLPYLIAWLAFVGITRGVHMHYWPGVRSEMFVSYTTAVVASATAGVLGLLGVYRSNADGRGVSSWALATAMASAASLAIAGALFRPN